MRKPLANRLVVAATTILGAMVTGRIMSASQFDPQPVAAHPIQQEADQKQNPAVSAAPTSLSGRWLFDPTQSDDAKQKMRDAMTDRPRPSGFGPRGGGAPMGEPSGGPGRGGRGGRGFGGPPDRPTDGADRREVMRTVFEPPVEITITPSESEISIIEKDGRLRTLHPDGKKYKTEAGSVEIRTRWEKQRLIVESRWPRNEKVTENYDLAPDRSRLAVTLRFERSPMPTVTVRRIYLAANDKMPPEVTE